MTEARYPSGKGEVCKTFIRGFDSHPRLQVSSFAFSQLATSVSPRNFRVPFPRLDTLSFSHQAEPREAEKLSGSSGWPQRSQSGLNVSRWRSTIPAVRSGKEMSNNKPRWRHSIALQIHGRALRNNANGANVISNPTLPHVAHFNNPGGTARRQSRRYPGRANGFESIRSKALPSHHDGLIIFMMPL